MSRLREAVIISNIIYSEVVQLLYQKHHHNLDDIEIIYTPVARQIALIEAIANKLNKNLIFNKHSIYCKSKLNKKLL